MQKTSFLKKVRVKVPLKINLNLDVFPVDDKGFHPLQSLVASINVFDTVTVKKRKDNQITLKQVGKVTTCPTEKHSAYKCAVAFMQAFGTSGVDIVVKKRIGEGAGLGGSSADIVGVALGMAKLFGITTDLTEFLSKLGSDTVYMANGGWALISGYGNTVKPVSTKAKLYLNLFTTPQGCPCKQVFADFDKLTERALPTSSKVATNFENQLICEGLALCKNDLSTPATAVYPHLQATMDFIDSKFTFMSGSGSTIYTVHLSKTERNKVYKSHKKMYPYTIVKAKTL